MLTFAAIDFSHLFSPYSNATTFRQCLQFGIISHFSSAVEQLTRNEQVEGSNPLSGS